MGKVGDRSGLPGLAAAPVHQPGCALLDSSFRWNDDGGRYKYLVIPAKARLQDAGVDSSLRWNDNGSDYEYFVIPAQAGIQWFRQAIPAQRE